FEETFPRTRERQFSPSLFERNQRNQKARLASMLDLSGSGVSTREVSNVVDKHCGTSISKSFVSQLTAELDPMVREWRNRSLSETKFPYIVTDVLYIKVREDRRVVSKSCHVAIGMSESGNREIIGLMIQDGESEST